MKLYIARDKNGSLAIYKKEPESLINEKWIGGCSIWLSSDDFPEVTFENSPQIVEVKLANNMLLLDEIKYYKDIRVKIDALVKNYYNKVIKCNYTYELLSWRLLENNEIMIIYSFVDYHDERCNDDVTVTIEELNESSWQPNKYV